VYAPYGVRIILAEVVNSACWDMLELPVRQAAVARRQGCSRPAGN
jgi:hypothetical protein